MQYRGLLEGLISECRFAVTEGSAIQDLLKNPEVHIAGVNYHRAAMKQTKDPKARARHQAQIKHHSKQAKLLRRGGKERDEGAGDPDLHTKAVEVLGRRGRPKPGRRGSDESAGMGGQGAY